MGDVLVQLVLEDFGSAMDGERYLSTQSGKPLREWGLSLVVQGSSVRVGALVTAGDAAEALEQLVEQWGTR